VLRGAVLVAVGGNPRENIAAMERAKRVMKGSLFLRAEGTAL
jgi:hypothetical protein